MSRFTNIRLRRAHPAVALASVLAASLLTACGVVAAFVPPISVDDPLGVDGQTVTAELAEGTLDLQAVSHLDETRTFDLADLEQDLRGFSLAGFHANAGFTDTMTLNGPEGSAAADHPARLTLTRAVVEAELWDDVNGHVSFDRDVALSLPFERSECTSDGCAYAYAGDEPLTDVLNVELTERDALRTLVNILMLNGEQTPNHGSFRVAVEIDTDASLAGYTATFQLTSEGSKIRLGG